ncbi:MAG: hypothetical protein ACP5E3_12540 [Bacteroidales bacterium]
MNKKVEYKILNNENRLLQKNVISTERSMRKHAEGGRNLLSIVVNFLIRQKIVVLLLGTCITVFASHSTIMQILIRILAIGYESRIELLISIF